MFFMCFMFSADTMSHEFRLNIAPVDHIWSHVELFSEILTLDGSLHDLRVSE